MSPRTGPTPAFPEIGRDRRHRFTGRIQEPERLRPVTRVDQPADLPNDRQGQIRLPGLCTVHTPIPNSRNNYDPLTTRGSSVNR